MRTASPARFEPTLPVGMPELPRASDFGPPGADGGPTLSGRLSTLGSGLLADLRRFDPTAGDVAGPDLLAVLAAVMRHRRRVLLHLRLGRRAVPLSLFPAERLAQAPLPPAALRAAAAAGSAVLHVEPALLQPPGAADPALVAADGSYVALAPLLWQLALAFPRDRLLPEIAGIAAYRVSPVFALDALDPEAPLPLAATLARLRDEPASLPALAAWPGLDRGRAVRLLHALYLQAALIVSRAHPAATQEL